MQIAIRDDQPRFDVSIGTRGAAKPTSGNPFDEIMRAMNTGDGDGRGAIEPDRAHAPRDDGSARSDDHRDRRPERSDDRPERSVDDTPARTAAGPEPAPDCETCVPEATAKQAPLDSAGQDAGGRPDQAPTDAEQPAAAAQPAEGTAEPAKAGSASTATDAAAQAGAAKTTNPQPLPIGDDVLAQLDALLQARLGTVGGGLASSPFALTAAGGAVGNGMLNHGLMTAVMAQSLAAQQPGANAPGAAALQAGQRNAPSIVLPGAAAKRAPGAEGQAQGQSGAMANAMDFKSIAAALANQPTGQRDAAGMTTAATTSATVDAAGTGTSQSGATATQALGERTAHTAKAEAPPPAHGQQRLSGPQFAERIGLTIARAAESGVDRVSIRLNPRELGRIDVKMELGQDGRMNLTVTADRPETLDQLQRNMRDLERSLNDAGFDTGAGDLNFSLRQEQSPNDQAGDPSGGGQLRDGDAGADEAGAVPEDGMIITQHSDGHMVVDLFV